MKQRLIYALVLAGLVFALDQGTKQWARASLQGEPTVVVVPGYLDLEYHENPGSAFGLLRKVPGARYILIGAGVLALLLVGSMVRRVESGRRLADTAYALVAGGALGNMLDRIYIGRVVDFIVMHWNRRYIWPAYNVADIALVAGVILLVLVLGRKQPEPSPKPRGKRKR